MKGNNVRARKYDVSYRDPKGRMCMTTIHADSYVAARKRLDTDVPGATEVFVIFVSEDLYPRTSS